MPQRVRVALLGPVQIEVDGAPLAVDTRKAIALLAYLAVTGRPASRETVAALLWPESGDDEARGALRRTLSVLKAALHGAGIAIDRTAVVLRQDEVAVDVAAFRAALARARSHGDDPDAVCPACLAALDEAIALDRGEFMAGFALRDSEPFDAWQFAEGEAHRRDLAGALERAARGWAGAGVLDASVAAAHRWLEIDPLHEPVHRLLMTTLARAGEPAAAIRQYRECVRVLDAELGVAPLAETTELYEAIRAGRLGPPERPAPPPVPSRVRAPTGSTPLLGRDAAVAALGRAVRGADPDGRLVVVEGEPGIGKSRLVAAFTDRMRGAGAVVAEARAYPGETAIPFAVVAGLLRSGIDQPGGAEQLRALRPEQLAEIGRLVPVPGHAPIEVASSSELQSDPFGRVRLITALADALIALVAGSSPGLLVVDDLHLADASSVEFIGYLARRLAGHRVLLIVTWRPDELADEDRARILGPTGRGSADTANVGSIVRLTLQRLDRADVAALAQAALGEAATAELTDALYAESEGLPLYVSEALAAAASGTAVGADIPGGVVALLRSRIHSVGEVAGQVLAAAAVIGRSFDLTTVRLASGRSEDETVGGLEELIRRGLVRELGPAGRDEPRYEFTHGRMRDVAYDDLGLARRRLLHRRVAEALAGPSIRSGDERTRWALVANHEELAGRFDEAAEAHRRAGDYARAVFANREAREHIEAALALGHPAAIELRETLGEVLTLLGDYAAAIGHFEAAAALASPNRLAAIEHRLGLVHARRGDWARAASHLDGALALAVGREPAGVGSRAAILADRSVVAHRLADPSAAEQLAHEALAIAEGSDDQPGIARAADILGLIERARPDLTAARAYLERAREAADRANEMSARIAARNSLALVLADAGDRAAAVELTTEALALCVHQGDRHREAALENNLADLYQALGRRDEALVHLKRAVSIFAEVGGRPGELEPEIWKLVEW